MPTYKLLLHLFKKTVTISKLKLSNLLTNLTIVKQDVLNSKLPLLPLKLKLLTSHKLFKLYNNKMVNFNKLFINWQTNLTNVKQDALN